MAMEEDKEKNQAETEEEEETVVEDKPDNLSFSNPNFYNPSQKKKSKKFLFIIIILIVLALIGFFFMGKIKSVLKGGSVQPSPTPTVEQTPSPSPIVNPLIRSDWSLEVLNGSGTSGLAKKIASKLQDLGYPVVKTGNADKDNYPNTEVFVKKELLDKIDLVIADLKDVIKISSVAGELTEGTASARIIIGKDSI